MTNAFTFLLTKADSFEIMILLQNKLPSEKHMVYVHTTYRKNNKLEKCVGMGLNGVHIK